MDALTPNPALYNVPFRTTEFNGMPYRRLGQTGLQVSNIGLGTWKVGLPETGDGSRVGESDAFAIFDKALELGVTFWDTANRYNLGSGNSERVIGRWFAANAAHRRDILLATKLFGGMDGTTPNHGGLSRSNILDSVEASLTRLQTDWIDVLYFHGFDPHSPAEESLAAVEDLIRAGKVRYFAVSNFTVDQLELYRRIADEASISVRCRIAAVQNQFDVLYGEQSERVGVLGHAADNGISFVPWSPLARGLLTDRYLDAAKVGPGDRRYDEGDWQIDADTSRKLSRLAELGREWGVELSQLVMAYMLTLPGMGPLIPSSSTIKQLESNAAAGKLALDPAQLERVREALDGGHDRA
ncbi:aldo/keto reductase [Paenibacillus hemerocallicola]|uniref:Aldo/keto reductase n=1 Tax=Paenibacillus hemerocallicola TaxID=1172614 RepID=A0A5C4T8N9_9BACL|nr:aldo/keto reductase [Paenibacillus hemerocallicola]TNJ65438.1 aldo/keto reductase [Paenibacillus hemerocallicola]